MDDQPKKAIPRNYSIIPRWLDTDLKIVLQDFERRIQRLEAIAEKAVAAGTDIRPL